MGEAQTSDRSNAAAGVTAGFMTMAAKKRKLLCDSVL